MSEMNGSGPAELGIPRRQLLPDTEHAQVACVAVVGRDGVVVAPCGVRDHRTVGEEHQVIPRQRNALAPGGIVVNQRRREGLLALVLSLDVAHARLHLEAHALLFQPHLHGLDERVVLVVLGVDDHRQLEQRLADVHGEAGQVAPALDQRMLGGQREDVGPVVPEVGREHARRRTTRRPSVLPTPPRESASDRASSGRRRRTSTDPSARLLALLFHQAQARAWDCPRSPDVSSRSVRPGVCVDGIFSIR